MTGGLSRRRALGYAAGMKITVTGARGFIGAALLPALRLQGHEAVALRRSAEGATSDTHGPSWTVEQGVQPKDGLSGFDAVVHLAGESVGQRWSAARKASILESRVAGTRRIVEAIAAASPRPSTLVCASGIGIFGDTGDREVDDDAPPGRGFLAEVARAWEAEAQTAERLGVRVACMRFGLVLGAERGSLPLMLPAFRLGLGGRLGDGRQWLGWVHEDDAVASILHALATPSVKGGINVIAPGIVRNADFARALGDTVGKPARLPAPRFALRLALGEMSELLLTGQRATPKRLLGTGFTFRHPTLGPALRDVLSA
jgi:hypothetical protein